MAPQNCPHCGTARSLAADSTCPSCHKSLSLPRFPEAAAGSAPLPLSAVKPLRAPESPSRLSRAASRVLTPLFALPFLAVAYLGVCWALGFAEVKFGKREEPKPLAGPVPKAEPLPKEVAKKSGTPEAAPKIEPDSEPPHLVKVETAPAEFVKAIRARFAVTYQIGKLPVLFQWIEETNLASQPSQVHGGFVVEPGQRVTIVALETPFPAAVHVLIADGPSYSSFTIASSEPSIMRRARGWSNSHWARQEPLIGKPGDVVRICQFGMSSMIKDRFEDRHFDENRPLIPLPDGVQNPAVRWTINLKIIEPNRRYDSDAHADFITNRYLKSLHEGQCANLLIRAKERITRPENENRSNSTRRSHAAHYYRQLAGISFALARLSESPERERHLADAVEFAETAASLSPRPESWEIRAAAHAAQGELGKAIREQNVVTEAKWLKEYYSPPQIEHAAKRLAEYERRADELALVAIKQLSDPAPDTRRQAALEVAKLGRAGELALPTLATLVKDEDETVRSAAASAEKRLRMQIAERKRPPWKPLFVRALGEGYPLAFDPSGGRLVSVDWEKPRQMPGIAYWDTTTGECVKRVESANYQALTFREDGNVLGAMTPGSIHDADSGKRLAVLQHNGPTRKSQGQMVEASIFHEVFNRDGTLLATGGTYTSAFVWDPLSGTLLANLEGHEKGVDSLAFSPDGTLLAVGEEAGTIKLWEWRTRTLLATLEGHLADVYHLTFSPDGQSLASASIDNTIRLWSIPNGMPIIALRGRGGAISALAFHPEGKLLAAGCEDGLIRFWDPAVNDVIGYLVDPHLAKGDFDDPVSYTHQVLFSPDGKSMASAGSDRKIKLWDVPAYPGAE